MSSVYPPFVRLFCVLFSCVILSRSLSLSLGCTNPARLYNSFRPASFVESVVLFPLDFVYVLVPKYKPISFLRSTGNPRTCLNLTNSFTLLVNLWSHGPHHTTGSIINVDQYQKQTPAGCSGGATKECSIRASDAHTPIGWCTARIDRRH